MPIHHAVLALLGTGPSYGYELKTQFEESVGPQWGELNIGHLYQVLDRLERDSLVTKRVVPQSGRPDRVVYRLTKAGRDELDRWLATPFVRRAYRDDLFLKLLAASRLGQERLADFLQLEREALLGELSGLSELRRRYRSEPLVSLLVEAAILHTKADVRLVEQAENAAGALTEAAEVAADQETRTDAAASGS